MSERGSDDAVRASGQVRRRTRDARIAARSRTVLLCVPQLMDALLAQPVPAAQEPRLSDGETASRTSERADNRSVHDTRDRGRKGTG